MMFKNFGLLMLILLAVALVGCKSNEITAKSVRSNMSPDLESIAEMREQRKNTHARTINTNWRQLWDDLDHILLLDHPVRLSEYPIP